jgi:TetR/AcrR family transcriptional repressor of nem operon
MTAKFNAAIEAGNIIDEEMRQKVAKALLLWKQDMVDIIREGITTNEFKPDIEPDEIAWQLISLIESSVIISKTIQNLKLRVLLLDKAKHLVRNLTNN